MQKYDFITKYVKYTKINMAHFVQKDLKCKNILYVYSASYLTQINMQFHINPLSSNNRM